MINKYVEIFKNNGFKITSVYDHGFNVVINNLQHIFIRPLDKKAYASLSYNSDVFRDIYIGESFRSKEIGFAGNKDPQKLYDDVLKRLINDEFCINQWNELRSLYDNHVEYVLKKDSIKEQVESIDLDLRFNETSEEFNLYHGKSYGKVMYYSDSMSIKLSNIPAELGIELLKFLESKEAHISG